MALLDWEFDDKPLKTMGLHICRRSWWCHAVPGATVAGQEVPAVPEGVPAAPSVETGNLGVEAKEPAYAGERDSPVETEEGKRTEINAEGENEPLNKRPRVELEDEIRQLLSKVTEGFSLTKSALEKVQQHLDLSKATSSDLSQLAAEFHHETVSAKYSLSQIQALLATMQNLEPYIDLINLYYTIYIYARWFGFVYCPFHIWDNPTH